MAKKVEKVISEYSRNVKRALKQKKLGNIAIVKKTKEGVEIRIKTDK